MFILGISCYYHDSAACLLKDGLVVAAVQEERFSRIRHDDSFPTNSINFCLESFGLTISDLEAIVYYEKPFLKFERIFETFLQYAPKGIRPFVTGLPVWLSDKLFLKSKLEKELINLSQLPKKTSLLKDKIFFSEHHLSHAASAFYPSNFNDAAILTLDGVGEWTTTSISIGSGSDISRIKEIRYPHSLGLLYSAITLYTGFKVNSGEYKVMGLAPYGTPVFKDLIRDNLIEIRDDGSFKLNMRYFGFCESLSMINKNFEMLFGGPARKPEAKITQKEMDIASSIQAVCEEVVIKMARSIREETDQVNLCLSGGVALNCVANGKLIKENIFDSIWIQPAAGDAGGAVGAALACYHMHFNRDRVVNNSGASFADSMSGSYLGPIYDDDQVEESLVSMQAKFHKLDMEELCDEVARQIADGKAVGWMQGRMEFGPRALGARSIIGDPRNPQMQEQLNLKVKFRESFRPFAPSVKYDKVTNWFDLENDSPYMLIVADVRNDKKKSVPDVDKMLFGIEKLKVPRSEIPAVTHVDFSARIQTVHPETNPGYYKLLSAFESLTGCPVLINTSFNVRGEPIVCTPEDAFRCFMGTNIDLLVIGEYMLYKEEQDTNLMSDYSSRYDLD